MRKSPIRYLVAALGGLALALGAIVPAQAFTFDNIGGFTFGTEVSTAGAGTGVEFFNLVGTPPNTYATIGWGNINGPSFVTATDPFGITTPVDVAKSALNLTTFSGTINPGDTVVISLLTHQNSQILIPFLTSINIDNRLRISDGGPFVQDLQTTHINLTETPNVGPPDGSGCDPSTQIPATAPCSDFFLFPIANLGDEFFTDGGVNYQVSFNLVPLAGALFDIVTAECDPTHAGLDSCGRIRTAENSTNQIEITMTLTRLGVPAPASLVLLGLALVGVGTVGRLRRTGAK